MNSIRIKTEGMKTKVEIDSKEISGVTMLTLEITPLCPQIVKLELATDRIECEIDNAEANAIDALSGITYNEWQRIKAGVDAAFKKKKREFERELKLSDTDEAKRAIQLQFG